MIVVIVGCIASFLGCCFGFLVAAMLSSGLQDDAYRAGYSAGRLYQTVGRDKYDDLADDLWNYGGNDD